MLMGEDISLTHRTHTVSDGELKYDNNHHEDLVQSITNGVYTRSFRKTQFTAYCLRAQIG